MCVVAGRLEQGRAAFDRQAWADAYAHLSAADVQDAIDHERLAIAAHLVGKDAESDAAWERAHREYLRVDSEHAARCAFWLAFALLLRGESARASGWLARAERLVEASGRDCATRALLLMPVILEHLDTGDHRRAEALADEALAVAQRCGDQDALARHPGEVGGRYELEEDRALRPARGWRHRGRPPLGRRGRSVRESAPRRTPSTTATEAGTTS
jgi:hypothetical protein